MNAMVMALMADTSRHQEIVTEYADNVCLALEAAKDAARKATEMKRAYDLAEAEFLAEVMLTADGKNAEARKAQVEAALAKARSTTTLASAYAMMVAARYDADDKEMAKEQMAIRFRAAEVAGQMQAAAVRLAFKWNDAERMKTLSVWRIERVAGVGYDQYSAAVVIASSEEEARYINPNGTGNARFDSTWPVEPSDLKVTLIGTAERNLKAGTVVCASFHAG